MKYPKRLIEVDLPIARISAHARREKSIRHGHISTLHIWWARRPLAACRAVICAALWPDPVDALCPDSFLQLARREMLSWASHERQRLLSEDSRPRFEAARKDCHRFDGPDELRAALLDFIADFANWDNSTAQEYLDTSRALTQAAHAALGGAPGTRPLVVDPFAGGGSIPLEALRVGADAFASDLNPVAVLLNKVMLEYVPKYGQHLADEVRKCGEWMKREAEKELAEFYPRDSDGGTPIAYLWSRTIQCEGPGCGAEVPLIRSLWLGKKPNNQWALRIEVSTGKRVDVRVVHGDQAVGTGTMRKGAATCPICGFTTPVERIRSQLNARLGGTDDARLVAVVLTRADQRGRFYREPVEHDLLALANAAAKAVAANAMLPDEPLPPAGTLGFRIQPYGFRLWRHLFTARQRVTLATLSRLVRQAGDNMRQHQDEGFSLAVQEVLALAVGKMADYGSSFCTWMPQASQETVAHTFARQALPMVWDFAEAYPFAESSGGWEHGLNFSLMPLEHEANSNLNEATVEPTSATEHPLPNDSADALITDPPYYDAVPYADLSDFFLVWITRSLHGTNSRITRYILSPKDEECVVHDSKGRGKSFFESTMRLALAEARRVVKPEGIGVVVFAHKSTSGWESQLQAMVDSGWTVTGSWPIDTERGARLRAMDSAALASSVHLICRPRENRDRSMPTEEIGDWRDVLEELPRRIHEWMPRLANEGVVGADAIFACLGPALEIFSRYSHVEKTSGDVVPLKEYLEQVWAAVAKEALSMVFDGADASGFEPDARLTAIWLWTLNAGQINAGNGDSNEDEEEESESITKKVKTTGFVLEYDAARKIAQGLGAHLENLSSLVEISGEQARLLAVGERARYLFGKDEGKVVAPPRKKREPQMDLFKVVEIAESTAPTFGETKLAHVGETVLDRIHQSMILFAAGRSEALTHLLVESEVGHDPRFWRLAQALSALYTKGSDEKRWVDGVLARKKGLGL